MDERASCLTCDTTRTDECESEHPARAAIRDEYQALYRVYTIAYRLTLNGRTLNAAGRDQALRDLESAVSEAQDALPYHLKSPE